MSVTLISVSHDTVVSNKHEERTKHYYVIFSTEVGSMCVSFLIREKEGGMEDIMDFPCGR